MLSLHPFLLEQNPMLWCYTHKVEDTSLGKHNSKIFSDIKEQITGYNTEIKNSCIDMCGSVSSFQAVSSLRKIFGRIVNLN